MSAAIVWVEIPVLDLPRALAFYNTLFQLQSEAYGRRRAPLRRALDDPRQARPLAHPDRRLSPQPRMAPWIYLYSEDPLEELLARVEAAGGEVLTPLTSMGDAGSYTAILDTEGNTIALYTLPDGA